MLYANAQQLNPQDVMDMDAEVFELAFAAWAGWYDGIAARRGR